MNVDVESVLRDAQRLCESGRLQDAIRLLEDTLLHLEDQPGRLPWLLLSLANLRRRDSGYAEEGLTHLLRAKSILENQVRSKSPEIERGFLHACLGMAFEEAKNWAEARIQYEMAVPLLDVHHQYRAHALLSLASQLQESEPDEALKYVRLLLSAADGLPSGSFTLSSFLLAGAQIHAQLELAAGRTPDPAHLQDALDRIQQVDPTFKIPDEIDDLLREIGAGRVSGSRSAHADRAGLESEPDSNQVPSEDEWDRNQVPSEDERGRGR